MIARRAGGARLAELPAGHVVHHDAPAEFAAAVGDLLSGPDCSTGGRAAQPGSLPDSHMVSSFFQVAAPTIPSTVSVPASPAWNA